MEKPDYENEDSVVRCIAQFVTDNLPEPEDGREAALLAMALIASGQTILTKIIDKKINPPL